MGEPETQNHLNQKIERLQNQINLLQQKVIQLEAKFMTVEQDSKYAISAGSEAPEATKIIQQGDSLRSNKSW
jgi:predicted  nucleic acid-binding Zn-ribbon protein